MHGTRKHFLLGLMVIVVFSVALTAGQQRGGGGAAAGVYTGQQATAGRTAFQTNCAGCHLADLSGQGDAAPLRGSEFMGAWGARTTKELLSFMQLTMPPARPGGLNPQEYLDIVAFILQQNGAAAGNQAFSANTEVAIRSE